MKFSTSDIQTIIVGFLVGFIFGFVLRRFDLPPLMHFSAIALFALVAGFLYIFIPKVIQIVLKDLKNK